MEKYFDIEAFHTIRRMSHYPEYNEQIENSRLRLLLGFGAVFYLLTKNVCSRLILEGCEYVNE